MDPRTTVPNKSRNVFEAIVEWQSELERAMATPTAFAEYVHVLEAMLQDDACRRYAELMNRFLWDRLSVARLLELSSNVADEFAACLHTCVRWLVLDLSRLNSRILGVFPGRILDDLLDKQDREEAKAGRWDSFASYVRREYGRKTINLLEQRYFEDDPAIHYPSDAELNAMEEFVLLPSRENMTQAIMESEFGRMVKDFATLDVDDSSSEALPPGTSRAVVREPIDSKRADIMADADEVLSLRIRFIGAELDPARVGFTLGSIATALQTIDGVAVSFEKWGTGSLWARLNIFVRNIWAKDEVREVVTNGCRAAEAHYLQKPIEEALKLKEERLKIEDERVAAKRTRSEGPTKSERRRMNELELREKEATVRSKEIDNAIKSLEAMRKASELFRDGILKADKVEIDIEEICYFLFDGTNVTMRALPPIVDQKKNVTEQPPSSE